MMPKYIKRDDLIVFLDWDDGNGIWTLSDEELKHLEDKAIDAVPVVRCKDCSWTKKGGFCRRHGHHVREDFFCAYGTTGSIEGLRPQKKAVEKTKERCMATGHECSRCMPGPCAHRRTVIADDSGQ